MRHRITFISCLLLAGVLLGAQLCVHRPRLEPTLREQQPSSSEQAFGSSPPPAACVFLLRDAGETLALLPVLRRLRATSPKNIAILGVLTGHGTAPASTLSEPGVTSFAALGIEDPALAQRNVTLSVEAVARILDVTRPSLLVTGIVSAVQLQVARAVRASGAAAVIGFDDGLGTSVDASSWPVVALSSLAVDELWTVADPITAKLSSFASPIAQRVLTVGSPALEAWPEQAVAAGPAALAALRASAFGVRSPATPVVLYFGGYGVGYEAAVQTFAAAAARLQRRADPSGPPPVAIAFARHPGPNFTSDFERKAFAAAGVVASFVENASSALLAAVANLSVSQDSTASNQALLVGTPSVFCTGRHAPPPANLGVATGLIPVADSPEAFVRAFADAQRDGFRVSADRIRALGVPLGAEARMADRIAELQRRQWRRGQEAPLQPGASASLVVARATDVTAARLVSHDLARKETLVMSWSLWRTRHDDALDHGERVLASHASAGSE